MIYPQTMLTVADNTVKKGYVYVLGGNKKMQELVIQLQ
jgi:hypothetical protein